MEMVSEREIEAALAGYNSLGKYASDRARMKAALEAAARVRAEAAAETLIDTVSEEVWNHDASQDNCNVIDKDGLTNAGEPVANYIEVTDPALMQFAEWFRRNYPGPDTIIHKPDWHSPK